MVAFENRPTLGYGIYTVPEVAALLRLPNHKVRYWLNKFWDGRLAASAKSRFSWGEEREKAVNFYTLIEFYVFYQLREHGVSVGKILRTYELLSNKFNIAYPFASYKIMTDGKDILFSLEDGESIIGANPKWQHAIPGIIKDFVQKIDYENENQLAEKFFPAGRSNAVVISPHHQMGQPVIEGTNISAAALYAMHKAGESTQMIAGLYNLQERQVRDAIQFYQKAA